MKISEMKEAVEELLEETEQNLQRERDEIINETIDFVKQLKVKSENEQQLPLNEIIKGLVIKGKHFIAKTSHLIEINQVLQPSHLDTDAVTIEASGFIPVSLEPKNTGFEIGLLNNQLNLKNEPDIFCKQMVDDNKEGKILPAQWDDFDNEQEDNFILVCDTNINISQIETAYNEVENQLFLILHS